MIICIRPNSPVKPGNRFRIMIEHIGLSIEDDVQGIFVAVEIRNQHFYPAFGIQSANFANRLCPVGGTTIRQIVAVYRSDYRVSKIEMLDGFGDVPWLCLIQISGLTFADSTKAAVASTNITTEHERCGPVRPAFKDVWAARFLANGMQIQPLNQVQDLVLSSRIAKTNFEPFRLRIAYLP